MRSLLDKAGITISGLCAIHCIAMPLLIVLLPLIGLSFFASETFERIIIIISATLALASLCWSYNNHRKMHPLAIAAAGFAFIAIGHIAEHSVSGNIFMFIGGTSVATSHLVNHKLCVSCKACKGCIHE